MKKNDYLGEGAYGQVSIRNGFAVKKFKKLSHLIQEYTALKYVEKCKNIVKCTDVNFNEKELYMELYDCNLKYWLNINRSNHSYILDNLKNIIYNILCGLVELHDRKLVHGDLKPANILVKLNPFKVVLGDCGFVSIDKYSKVLRTTETYRDPIISFDSSHDMYSFGIFFLEILANIKINRQVPYDELQKIINSRLSDSPYYKIIYNLLHVNKQRRPSARYIIRRLFHTIPSYWIKPKILISFNYDSVSSVSDNFPSIKLTFKKLSKSFNIYRPKKSYAALITYINIHHINLTDNIYLMRFYVAVTLLISASLFITIDHPSIKFNESHVLNFCENNFSLSDIYTQLNLFLSDTTFISILLYP